MYNPCNRTVKWLGVGHQLIGGGKDRNAFGQDFAANGHVRKLSVYNLVEL